MSTENNASFGEKIRDLRVESGYTQGQWADISGVTVQTQRNYEAGRRLPDLQYLGRLDAAGINLSSLFDNLSDADDSGTVLASVASLISRVFAIIDQMGVVPDYAETRAILDFATTCNAHDDSMRAFIRSGVLLVRQVNERATRGDVEDERDTRLEFLENMLSLHQEMIDDGRLELTDPRVQLEDLGLKSA